MTRDQIVRAVQRNTPFTLRMADGREYTVPHRDFITVPPNASFVIVVDRQGKDFDVLPLLTVTGLHQAGEAP